jgi:hypothetical protein
MEKEIILPILHDMINNFDDFTVAIEGSRFGERVYLKISKDLNGNRDVEILESGEYYANEEEILHQEKFEKIEDVEFFVYGLYV